MEEVTAAQPITVKTVTEIRHRGDKQMVSVEAKGYLYHKDDAMILTYEEEMPEAGRVKTTVKMKESEVVIIRSGAVSMRQVFRKGASTTGSYRTPYGTMEMETTTENIQSDWRDATEKGKLFLTYLLKIQGEETGRHCVTVMFKGNKGGKSDEHR